MAENNPLNPSVFKYTDKIKWEQVYKIISEFNSEIHHHHHHHHNPVRCVRLDLVVIAWLLSVEDLLFWTLAPS